MLAYISGLKNLKYRHKRFLFTSPKIVYLACASLLFSSMFIPRVSGGDAERKWEILENQIGLLQDSNRGKPTTRTDSATLSKQWKTGSGVNKDKTRRLTTDLKKKVHPGLPWVKI